MTALTMGSQMTRRALCYFLTPVGTGALIGGPAGAVTYCFRVNDTRYRC